MKKLSTFISEGTYEEIKNGLKQGYNELTEKIKNKRKRKSKKKEELEETKEIKKEEPKKKTYSTSDKNKDLQNLYTSLNNIFRKYEDDELTSKTIIKNIIEKSLSYFYNERFGSESDSVFLNIKTKADYLNSYIKDNCKYTKKG